MIKRNKEIELEALEELQKQDVQKKYSNFGGDIKRLQYDKEKADLEHALALSNAIQEER